MRNDAHVLNRRTRLFAAVVLAAGTCGSGHDGGPWEIPIGADRVQTFRTASIPEAFAYTALAVEGRPNETLVVPGRLDRPLENIAPWEAPDRPGEPPGRYVFVLDSTSGEVGLLTLEQFLGTATAREDLRRRFGSSFRELDPAGEESGYALVSRRGGRTLVAVESWDSRERTKTSFGIPSLIPFLGRQHWFEKETLESGTAFLEVFAAESPARPLVRFERSFRDLRTVPAVGSTAAWVQGAEKPTLVVVEVGRPAEGRKPGFFVVRVPSRSPEHGERAPGPPAVHPPPRDGPSARSGPARP